MCCHPALDPAARIALTLRSVCGQDTKAIAAAFMVPEPTVAQRIVRAKRKIRQAGIRMRVPGRDELPGRLAAVLRVVYLVYTQGHLATSGPELVRGELCDQAIRLARALAALLPDEPEAAGLLALLLLTDARRDARVDGAGNLVLLADQDRSRWDRERIAEGELLLEAALRARTPGAVPAARRDRRLPLVRGERAGDGLARDRRAVRGADQVRADGGRGGEPRGRGRDVRGARGRPGHPGRARRRFAAHRLAPVPYRAR